MDMMKEMNRKMAKVPQNIDQGCPQEMKEQVLKE